MNFSYAKTTERTFLSFTVRNGILFFPFPIIGELKELHIKFSAPLSVSFTPVNYVTFNVRFNGTALFAGADRPTIHVTESMVSKTGLSIAGGLGDAMLLDVNAGPGLRKLAPAVFVTMIAVIDDGIEYAH